MHLGVLQKAHRNKPSEQRFVIQYQAQDFIFYESKGRLQDVASLALPCPDTGSLWLCLQFHGRSIFPGGRGTEPDSLFSFKARDGEIPLTLSADKHWALFLGLSAASKEQLLAEFPSLRDHFDELGHDVLPAVPISYLERQALENFSNMSLGPFSTVYHVGHLFLKLYSNYLLRLTDRLKRSTEEPNIQIYHRAVAYIRDNYLDKRLSRETIADAIHCSTRSLSRAFEGKSLSLNATILTIRLYKGRELLIQRPDLSVEQIALSLHFGDAKYFAVQYKKTFHRTPREERKIVGAPIKK